MPRPGIHPVVHQMTVVLRNGASVVMDTTVPRTGPYFLRQDVTNSPLWTGKDSNLAGENEHMAKFMKKYDMDAGDMAGTAGAGKASKQ